MPRRIDDKNTTKKRTTKHNPQAINPQKTSSQPSSQTSGLTIGNEKENLDTRKLSKLIIQYCLPRSEKNVYSIAIDVTPNPRPFSPTLKDKTIVHYPNPAPGNKPIIIGHQFSAAVYLPEKDTQNAPPWVLPLDVRRVTSRENTEVVGIEQALHAAKDIAHYSPNKTCFIIADSKYSSKASRQKATLDSHVLLLARLPSRRNVYASPEPNSQKKAGHPLWFGTQMKLHDEHTHVPPDETTVVTSTTRRGRVLKVTLETWKNRLFRGSQEFEAHKHPFTLIRATVRDEAGKQVFKRPLWLMVQGDRRNEFDAETYYRNWTKRYDIEHFFRFGKQRLLMAAYQTPDVQHEENWWHLTQLAYVQLYLARELTQKLPYDWERYLPEYTSSDRPSSPSQVQRDFSRIHEVIGTPAKAPLARGVSSGREEGYCVKRRPKQAVIYKNKKRPKSLQEKASE